MVLQGISLTYIFVCFSPFPASHKKMESSVKEFIAVTGMWMWLIVESRATAPPRLLEQNIHPYNREHAPQILEIILKYWRNLHCVLWWTLSPQLFRSCTPKISLKNAILYSMVCGCMWIWFYQSNYRGFVSTFGFVGWLRYGNSARGWVKIAYFF